MSEVVSWFAGQLWGVFIGVIISLIVLFITNILPIGEDIRYKAIFYRRKIQKLIFNPTIKVFYTIKTQNQEEKKMKLDTFVKEVKEKLARNNFEFKSDRGNATIFKGILGKTEVEITLTPSYIFEGEEEERGFIVDYLQCDFKLIECKYNDFNGYLLNLIQIFRKLEASLEDVVGKWVGESLTCDIQRLYEFVGVLKNLKLSSLTGKIGGQYKVELFPDRMIVYGLIETTMTSMIKDIITYYY